MPLAHRHWWENVTFGDVRIATIRDGAADGHDSDTGPPQLSDNSLTSTRESGNHEQEETDYLRRIGSQD
jgi:hypothetical protein